MRLFDFARRLVQRIWLWFTRRYELRLVESDELPDVIPPRTLVVAREGDTFWSAGMICPCGCGDRLEMMLLEGVRPRWDVSVSASGAPSLHPSVWRNKDCKAHFWLKDGRVRWCA